MNVPAHIRSRSHAERLERLVADCVHIIAKKRSEAALEAKEQQLKLILNQERNQLP